MSTPMSTLTAEPAPTGPSGGFVRRNRVALGLTLAVITTLVLVSWANRDQAGSGGFLDPENADPSGARAVAQVLEDQGVPVEIVRGRAALEAATLDEDTTVVMTNPEHLGESTWSDLDTRVRRAGAVLVVAGLSLPVADGLGLGKSDLTPGPSERTVAADCSPEVDLMAGLSLTSEWDTPGVKGDGCFGDAITGRQLLVDRQEHRWVLTNPHPVSNEDVDLGENAAVVLRLFGQRDRVVWYVAKVDDTLVSDGVGLSRLLPPWLVPSLWLLAVATLALLLVRGRRLGPLVVEPIPVTIKALESTTALGRLYEQARDRVHAADLLVDGTARRLGLALGLAEYSPRADLARAVADRTGRGLAEVSALLPDRGRIAESIRSDADLVALAQNLHQLEEEVRTR